MQPACNHLFVKRCHLGLFFIIDQIQSHAQITVQDHRTLLVRFIELLAHTGYKNDRKFQSLTFMDTQDRHGIIIVVYEFRLAHIHLILL